MPFALDAEDLHDALPATPNGTGVLLLAGSSGRVESERADLLASHGARVRAIRWFGGVGQRPAPHEVPIELFIDELDLLRAEHDRVAVFGTSFGAEAALVTSSVIELDATIAISPSAVVWSGLSDEGWSSHWMLDGSPLPAVRFDPAWTPSTDPPEFRSLYESSLALNPALTAAATIRVERITGEILVTAGLDDRVWPSADFATAIADRRRAHGKPTTALLHPEAGHRMLLPGEHVAIGGVAMGRGGKPQADAEFGQQVWVEISRILELRTRDN